MSLTGSKRGRLSRFGLVILPVITLAVVWVYIVGWNNIWGDNKQVTQRSLPVAESNIESGFQSTKTNTITNDSVVVSTPSTPLEHDQSFVAQTHQDTQIDGALAADQSGNLILNQGVRDFFDYFLSAADEIGPEAAIAEIQRYINQYLTEPANEQATALLWNYLRYKRYELSLQQQPLSGGLSTEQDALVILRNNFSMLKNKRNELFDSQTDNALFGLEAVYQEHTLSTLELFADQSLTDSQRHNELERLQQNLPPELQASQREDHTQRERQRRIEQIAASSVDDSSFHQSLLNQGLDPQKADELLSYRQQQTQFDSLYQQYRRVASKLNADDKHYARDLASLRSSFFSQPEQQTMAKLRDLQSK